MKKIEKIALIVFLAVILISIIFFQVDYARVKRGKEPIFSIKIATYLDGGTTDYLGLGYKIINFNRLSGYDEIKIGIWSMQIDDFKEEYEKLEKWQMSTAIIESVKEGENIYIEITKEKEELENIMQTIYKSDLDNKASNEENDYKVTFYKGATFEEVYKIRIIEKECYISNKNQRELKLNKENSNRIIEIINKYTIKK